jgi:excisionase family DNA binding protein
MDSQSFETVTPTDKEALIARDSGKVLAHAYRDKPLSITVQDGKKAMDMVLPASAAKLLVHVLQEMAEGHGITVLPSHTEVTTQEAADLLNVSRPFLIQLLEDGKIPFHKVGAHRRLQLQDVVKYKQRVYAVREKVLDELVQQAQEHDMGY